MAEGTGQMESVGVRILLQIVHDVPVLIPRKHQTKVGDCRRYTVERDDVVVPELLHQHDFLVKPLCHPSGNDDQPHPGGLHNILTVLVLGRSSRGALRTLSATTSLLYLPFQISVTWEIRWACSPSFTTPSSLYDAGTV